MKKLLYQITKRMTNTGTALRALPFAVFLLATTAPGAFAQTDITVGMDPNFLERVRNETGISSGPIYSTDTRVTSLKELGVNDSEIFSLAGIEYFTALEYLDCMNNFLTVLDVSTLTRLKEIYCINNSLTTLDVSMMPDLTYLNCAGNRLTALNVSGLTRLKHLECQSNLRTALNVSELTGLERLICNQNQLTSLNVSGLTLDNLECGHNLLTALDVSGMTGLRYLECQNNRLTNGTLNITGCKLIRLKCEYNCMTPLTAPGASSITGYVAGSNPAETFNYNPQNASGFRPVTEIKGIPLDLTVGAALDLSVIANVLPADATNRTIVWSVSDDGDATISGQTLTPTTTLTSAKTNVLLFNATIADGTAPGTDYTQTCFASIVPLIAPVGSLTITPIPDQNHTGSAVRPTLTVKHGGVTLLEGAHYLVAYANNVNTGTATANVIGIGGYSGTRAVNFKIVPAAATVAIASDRIWASGYTLYIYATHDGAAQVYNLTGQLTTALTLAAGETTQTTLPAGVYVVTANGETRKVKTGN
jgi:hypothetical protein